MHDLRNVFSQTNFPYLGQKGGGGGGTVDNERRQTSVPMCDVTGGSSARRPSSRRAGHSRELGGIHESASLT